MKSILICAILAVGLSACVVHTAQVPDVVGTYERVWFHSRTVLILERSGEYSLERLSLAGEEVPKEAGIWRLAAGRVTLYPTSKSARDEYTYIRTLRCSVVKGRKLIFPISEGEDPKTVLPFEEEPNLK